MAARRSGLGQFGYYLPGTGIVKRPHRVVSAIREVMVAGSVSLFARDFFPRAEFYTGRARSPGRVREDGLPARPIPCSERQLQCVWFDPRFRPSLLKSSQGEMVEVEDPGIWNLEAGPDFLGAALRIGAGRRRVTGDIEVHLSPADWNHHRHAADPRYRRVRAHVTYSPGELPTDALPKGCVQLSLRELLAANPAFSFEHIDAAAYPFASRPAPTPCSALLASWSPQERIALLNAAGEERLRRKAERIAVAIRDKGADQTVYEETLTALGYKNNKAPCRRLAQQLPLAKLRSEARGCPNAAYALLMGVAGLLPTRLSSRWDEETRSFMRSLWDVWWRCRDQWEGRCLSADEWHLGGRPANRPARRLMAAACWFASPRPMLERWASLARGQRRSLLREACDWLGGSTGTYWDRRLTLSSPPQRKPIALVGKDRVSSLLLNVLIPFLAATGEGAAFRAGLLDLLPPEQDNTLVRQTAFSLFGQDHAPSLYRHGLRQQGLIQVFQDYCLNDRSRCASCTLPGLLENYRGKMPS